MGSIITFKCENCDFVFQDKDLIFYLTEEDKLIEETLTMENSNKMTDSILKGFLYESYCPHCDNLIKTYVPEMNNIEFNEEEIIEIINKSNTSENIKILIFDFKNTTYKDRRKIIENNTCPKCNEKIALALSENTSCPKCKNNLKEQ